MKNESTKHKVLADPEVIIEAFILAVIAEVNPELAEEFVISGQMHALVGGCVTFLIVFRTQSAL